MISYTIQPSNASYAIFQRDSDHVFVEWDPRLVWLASNTGIYLLSTPLLGEPVLEPMPIGAWPAPGVNVGFEAFGR